jgi:tetratricopeptide (TPR) repeat protein
MKTEVWLAFIFGVVFLLLSLCFAVVAFYLPKPPNPEVVGNFLLVMQTVLAIAASGVAAVIPGFLSVQLQRTFGTKGIIGIRAGGAIAVFVVIFYISPKTLAVEQLNKRVGFNELLSKCMHYIPVSGSPLPGALQYCMAARDFDAARWESYRQLARLHYWYGKYADAIENYKTAISLMVGKEEADIRSGDVAYHQQTEFSLMQTGISMGFVGLANAPHPRPEDKIENYRYALLAGEKAEWFVAKGSAGIDRSFDELLYMKGLIYAYIWITAESQQYDMEFNAAQKYFKEFLVRPGVYPQWAEYHLACLYSTAAQRKGGMEGAQLRVQARQFLMNSLNHLTMSESDKVATQIKLMKCRLQNIEQCSKPRGPEPMLCRPLFELAQGDEDALKLANSL